MGLPNVNIELQNGGLGLITPSADRVVGLVLNAIGYNLIPLNVAYQVFSLDDFNQRVLIANNAVGFYVTEAYRQVQEFYAVAGTGAELWLMFADPAATTAQLFSDGAIRNLLNAAEGRIHVVGVSRYLEVEPDMVTPDGLDPDILNALDDAQAMAEDFAKRAMPVRALLDGKHFSGNVTALKNLRTYTYNRVGVCLASTNGARNASMGLLLGSVAAIPPNVSIGRVKNGQVKTDTGYLTSGQTVKAFGGQAEAVHNKGYIFLRRFPTRAGLYWNDDLMAALPTDDYFSLSNGRVIDKAHRIAYDTFLEELNDTVLVNANTGKIVKATLKKYQAKIQRAIGLGMPGEISGVSAFVDPDQDVLGTSKLVVDLRIVPTGTNRAILVKLGLFNPAAA